MNIIFDMCSYQTVVPADESQMPRSPYEKLEADIRLQCVEAETNDNTLVTTNIYAEGIDHFLQRM